MSEVRFLPRNSFVCSLVRDRRHSVSFFDPSASCSPAAAFVAAVPTAAAVPVDLPGGNGGDGVDGSDGGASNGGGGQAGA